MRAEDTNLRERSAEALQIGIQFFAEDTTPAESGGVDEGESLFDGWDEEGADTDAAETEQPEGEEREGAEAGGDPSAAPQDDNGAARGDDPKGAAQDTSAERFKVVHLGKEQELTREEMIALAQKGMDYDHVREERDKYRQAPEFSVIDKMAEASGLTRQQYIEHITQMEQAEAERKLAAEMKEKFPDAPDELLSETARLKKEQAEAERRAAAEKREAEEKERTAAQRKERQQRELTEFIEAYPDIKDFEREIPKEVWQRVRGGESLLSAYRAHENEQLRAKPAALEKTQENKERAVGSTKGEGDGEVDDFLAGFFS